MNVALSSGTRLGRYEIRSPIGAGGMGEVYLAHDTQLRRPVALKLLPSNLTNDEERLRRFQREAQAAAALSHPNIAHVYEIGETDGIHFIAMEYIDGDTLREKIHHAGADLKELLEYLAQVAEGLNKAHAAGIIHRDLKPDNIMITRDGYAKVLDFGLAKLIEPQKSSGGNSSDDSTVRVEPPTQSGIILGTVSYMSPEQARGKAVDRRSDIFSFGCILYEATTGRKPFSGDNIIETVHNIIYSEPQPITEFNCDAPAELQRIISRCLAKETDERYQTIKEVAGELKELRREMESASARVHPSPPGGAKIVEGQRPPVIESGSGRAEKAGQSAPSVEQLESEVKRYKTGVALALLIIAGAAIAFGLYRFLNRNQSATKPSSAPQEMKVSRLTNNGKVIQATISPDGKYVVYVMADGERQSLWLRQMATSSNVQIVAPAEAKYWGLTFSLDGNYVYYVNQEKGYSLGRLYQVASVGGAPRKLLEHIDSAISFSPDGKRFAFLRGYSSRAESALVIVNADGTGEQQRTVSNSIGLQGGLVGIAWSPDGKMVACPAGTWGDMTLIGVQVEDGQEKKLTSQKWKGIWQAVWLGDGSGLVMTATGPSSNLSQVWRLDYPSGEAHKITNDFNNYANVSITSDSSALVTAYVETTSSIWVAPVVDASSNARQVTQGKNDGLWGLAWTPDGKIVYDSMASGHQAIWMTEADGTGQRQLTDDASAGLWPTVSPDGRFIVFVSQRTGTRTMWRMDIDGGNLKQLVNDGSGQEIPSISPDGRWVLYGAMYPGGVNLMRVPFEGGEPVKLSDTSAHIPIASPDGKLIACIYWSDQANPIYGVGVLPFEGGQLIKTFDIGNSTWPAFRWTLDGRALLYVDRSFFNIWSQPLDGGPPKRLTNFTSESIYWFDVSRDGKSFALARGNSSSDVVLISNFR